MFCNVADIIEDNGASYFWQIPEQHVPTLTNSQTAWTSMIIFSTVSGHVETVCLLSNRKPDSYMHLNLKMEDYYRFKDAEKEQGKK